MNSFLMIGQSNMAGRGFTREVPMILDEGIHLLRNGGWQIMTEPMNYDRPVAGTGLAASFAAALRQASPDTAIGLIPCADGGSSLDDWAAGGVLFDHAVAQARLAQRSSKLSGILWHQGENDSQPHLAEKYTEKLNAIITALRQALDIPEIPLLVGGLGDYLADGIYAKAFSSYTTVNGQLWQFAQTQPHCYFVTAAQLTANPDNIHFNAASLRLFGIRYAEAFLHQRHITAPPESEHDLLHTIYNRPVTANEQLFLLQIRFANGEISPTVFQQQMAGLVQ